MALGFLGSALGGIGHGIKSGAGFLGRGLGKLNGMGMDEDEEGFGGNPSANRQNAKGILGNILKRPEIMQAAGAMAGGDEGGGAMPGILGKMGPGGTPGFNPAAADSLPKGGMLGGDSGLINRRQDTPNILPQLQRPDAMPQRIEPLKESLDVSANLPMGEASVSPLAGQMIPQREIKEVRPPDFLGRNGATMDDTPLNHERYAYENQYMKDGHHPRRIADIGMAMLHGANEGFKATGDWRGALAGAGVGGVGAGINPQMARAQRFDKEQLPRITASRQEAERGQDRKFELQKRGADLKGLEARTAAAIAGTKDAELERRYRQAQIEKITAQSEAARLGKPVVKMITDEETGEIYEAQIYPDGRVERRGLSGTADLRQEGFRTREGITDKQIKSREGIADKQIGSREKIVGIQQRGATGRTAMSQSGADRRQRERLSTQYGDAPPIGSVPQGSPAESPIGGGKRQWLINEAMKRYGMTQAQAEAEADRRGIK